MVYLHLTPLPLYAIFFLLSVYLTVFTFNCPFSFIYPFYFSTVNYLFFVLLLLHLYFQLWTLSSGMWLEMILLDGTRDD